VGGGLARKWPEPIGRRVTGYCYWLRLFSSQTFSHINTPTFSNLVILHAYPSMKMEQAHGSKTSAYKIQMPGNYPEEGIQQNDSF